MTFKIGDKVRLVSGKWFDGAGNDLVGGVYEVVDNNPSTGYYIQGTTAEIAAVERHSSNFELVAKFTVGDAVELVEDYDCQKAGQRGVVTLVRNAATGNLQQMVYVDFGALGRRGRPIGMFDSRLKHAVKTPDSFNVLRDIEAVSKRVGSGSTQAILLSLMEEVGELATEVSIEAGTKNRAPSPDGVEGEAVDVLIVVCDLLTSLFGSLNSQELKDKVAEKLAKWERGAQ